MEKENLKNQALLEEFRQSSKHLHNIGDQVWKILSMFGTLCSVSLAVVYYIYLSRDGLSALLSGTRTLSSYCVSLLSLFFQAALFVLLLMILKLRHEWCLCVRDLHIKRKNFGFTMKNSLYMHLDVPNLFDAQSIHWLVMGALWMIHMVAIVPALIILFGVWAGLFFSFVYILPFAGMGVSISMVAIAAIGFERRKKLKEFIQQREEYIPSLISWTLLLSLLLVAFLYSFWGRDTAIFIFLLYLFMSIVFVCIFTYRWAIYAEDLKEKDKTIETIDILMDKELMGKIAVAQDEVKNGKTRSFDEFLKEVGL